MKSASFRGVKYPNFQSPLSGGVERIFPCLSSENHGNKSIRTGSVFRLFPRIRRITWTVQIKKRGAREPTAARNTVNLLKLKGNAGKRRRERRTRHSSLRAWRIRILHRGRDGHLLRQLYTSDAYGRIIRLQKARSGSAHPHSVWSVLFFSTSGPFLRTKTEPNL